MPRSALAAALTPTLLALGVLTACGSSTEDAAPAPDAGGTSAESPTDAPSTDPTTEPSATPSKDESSQAAPQPGAYVEWSDYDADPAAYSDSSVVLFFHASWCPDCQATDESLVSDGVPDGLTVVKVDFDDSTDLRQQYGVTIQHTFVLVEPDGNQLKKWTGTFTGADIADAAA